MSTPDYLPLAEGWIEQGIEDDGRFDSSTALGERAETYAALLLVIAQELRMIRQILEPKPDPWAYPADNEE